MSDLTLGGFIRERMDAAEITSVRELARRIGVAPETARRVLNNRDQPSESTLRKLADGLPAPIGQLRRLAGRPVGARGPFVLPPEADQLDQDQRDVVLSVVNALLRASAHSNASADAPRIPRLVGRHRDTDGPAEPR